MGGGAGGGGREVVVVYIHLSKMVIFERKKSKCYSRYSFCKNDHSGQTVMVRGGAGGGGGESWHFTFLPEMIGFFQKNVKGVCI